MASLRGVALAVVGGVLGTVAVTVTVAGCGGSEGGSMATDSGEDSTAEVGPGGGDGAGDVTRDTITGETATGDTAREGETAADAGQDRTVEAGSDSDSGDVADATDAADVMSEAEADVVLEAQADAPSEAQADADAAPLGPSCFYPDGGQNPVQQYAAQYGRAMCTGLGKCCAGFDAGGFNVSACAVDFAAGGWENTLPQNRGVYIGCQLNFDQTKATGCLAALQNFDCVTGGAADAGAYGAVTTACQGVLTGTIPVGSGGCDSSFECINGYCNRTVDGGSGTGVCTALVGSGGGCVALNDGPDTMCSQAGSATPLWCDLFDNPDGGATCKAPFASGATCYTGGYYDNEGCTTLLCGDDGLCGDPAAYPGTGFCSAYP